MSLSAADVKKVAHLARLAINENEVTQYTQELSNILDLMTEMGAVNTDHVAPMAHPLNVSQAFRPDVITEVNQRELFQSIAPAIEAGLYLVPKVIE